MCKRHFIYNILRLCKHDRDCGCSYVIVNMLHVQNSQTDKNKFLFKRSGSHETFTRSQCNRIQLAYTRNNPLPHALYSKENFQLIIWTALQMAGSGLRSGRAWVLVLNLLGAQHTEQGNVGGVGNSTKHWWLEESHHSKQLTVIFTKTNWN